jgi:hypothetical protein
MEIFRAIHVDILDGGRRATTSFHPLNPLTPPIRCLKRIRKILRFVNDFAVAKLHNAYRVRHSPVIGDVVLRDPEIPLALNSPDVET